MVQNYKCLFSQEKLRLFNLLVHVCLCVLHMCVCDSLLESITLPLVYTLSSCYDVLVLSD